MYDNIDDGSNLPHNITVDASIWTQIQNDNATLKNMVTELRLNNEKLQLQISEMNAGSSNEILSSPKKSIKVTKEVAKTSVKIHKPPPITVCGVNDLKKLMSNLKLEEAEGHEQQMKTLANGEIKILTGDEHQFRRTIKVLEEQKVEYHRYQLKTEKKFRAVIRGLHPETDPYDIKSELSELGHLVNNVTNIQIKKKVDPNNKFSDRTILRLPLFFVDLEPQANNKDIYDIKNLCYHIIKVEPPRKKKELPQCKNCQVFGHTQNYCFKTPKCVKCGEGHTSLNCPKSKKSKAKCANCGEGHTANWKGCIIYKNAIEKAHPKKTTAVQRIQQNPAKPVTHEVSFAQIASSSNENRKGPLTQTHTQQKKNVPSLSDVMTALTKLNERLDRLENSQPKTKAQKKKK